MDEGLPFSARPFQQLVSVTLVEVIDGGIKAREAEVEAIALAAILKEFVHGHTMLGNERRALAGGTFYLLFDAVDDVINAILCVIECSSTHLFLL
jgi:hypothetical protein